MAKQDKGTDPIAEAQAAANAEDAASTPVPAEGTDAKSNDQNKPKKEKHPLPEGYVTPVTYAKHLAEKIGKEVRPQVIYGYVRNSGWQKEEVGVAKQNTDGAWIVNVEKADAWWDAKEQRKVEREAAKEAKAKADAEKAAAAPAQESPAQG